jgi:hypothetical protein
MKQFQVHKAQPLSCQRLCGGTSGRVVLENYLPCKLKQPPTAAGTVLLGARRSAKVTPGRRVTRVPTTLHIGVRVLQIRMIENVLCLGPELELYPLPNPDLLEERCIRVCKTRAIQRISSSVAIGKLRRIGKRRTINAGARRIVNVELGRAFGRRQMQPIGPLRVSIRLTDVGLIVIQLDVVRLTSLQGDNGVELPAAQGVSHQITGA